MTIQEFIDKYTGKGYEKGETHIFWLDLLAALFGITDATDKIVFEKSLAEYGAKGFIDAYLPETRVLIEQKGSHVDLGKAEKQSDGALLTPYEQAKRYAATLSVDETPRWIITCNFREILIYNQNQRTLPPERILLSELGETKAVSRLSILVNPNATMRGRQEEISKEACAKVRTLYDALERQYKKKFAEGEYESDLNALCIRLVFLFYAEDVLLFGGTSMEKFDEFIRSCSTPANARRSLIALFETLNLKTEERDPCNTELNEFPYVNGGLFADKNIRLPEFDADIVRIMEHDCGSAFDWSGISPTIFGALFESILNPETRRSGGMHYTSPENIHKAIAPLFLDALMDEFEVIKGISNAVERDGELRRFQDKIASLTFLDPACGSGNFLTETYISLRKLENEILAITRDKEIKVSIANFYGIEINAFAATVAKTAMWIAESQMMRETERITGERYEFFPLRSFANIVQGNALELEWDTLRAVPNLLGEHLVDNGLESEARVYDYVIGNPPFVGYTLMNKAQKADMAKLFPGTKNLDFVCAWYKKANLLIKGKRTKCAFVSTNSIAQGETVASLWKHIDITIDFAYRTFRWDSESDDKAHVHCVIIGFHCGEPSIERYIFEGEKKIKAKNINAYLLDAPNIIIGGRSSAICNVPKMSKGNIPYDANGMLSNYSEEEKDELIKLYPAIAPYFKRLLGSEEFINNKKRYCLWFKDADITIIQKCPKIKDAIAKVKEERLASSRDATRKFAETPYLFGEIRQPTTEYIIVPSHSSEKREYVPMGFVSPDIIVNNAVLIIPNAELWHFAVLTSSVHMAWMRAVCGRLEMRYRYSKDIVYNNFVWPEGLVGDGVETGHAPSLRKSAQAILDARALYPESSLATLYDPLLMPAELRKAHNENDRLVMKIYGFDAKAGEEEVVGRLMEMYINKVGEK